MWGLLLATLLSGCIKAPDVVIVDRRTALEEQAMGHRPGLDTELMQAGLSARPAALTRAQFTAAGWRPTKDHDAIAALFEDAVGDTERTDQLLVRRCIGEAQTGLLVQTPEYCTGGAESSEVARLIERVNRNRRQVWAYVSKVRRVSTDAARDAWRRAHLVEMVCDAQVENAGKWGRKTCSD